MFKIQDIREMICLVDQTSVSELEIEDNGSRISIRKNRVGTARAEAPVVVEQQPHAAQPTATPVVQEVKAAIQEVKTAVKEAAPAVLTEQALKKILSPMVGTFYSSPEAGAAPFVKPGDQVQPSTVVCIVEAMKLFNEIEAEARGEIVKVFVENGQLVEYGQPLFLVKTEA